MVQYLRNIKLHVLSTFYHSISLLVQRGIISGQCGFWIHFFCFYYASYNSGKVVSGYTVFFITLATTAARL